MDSNGIAAFNCKRSNPPSAKTGFWMQDAKSTMAIWMPRLTAPMYPASRVPHHCGWRSGNWKFNPGPHGQAAKADNRSASRTCGL